MVKLKRRSFVGGLAAGVACLGTVRYVRGAAAVRSAPDLKLGLLSDTHIALAPGAKTSPPIERFKRALEWHPGWTPAVEELAALGVTP